MVRATRIWKQLPNHAVFGEVNLDVVMVAAANFNMLHYQIRPNVVFAVPALNIANKIAHTKILNHLRLRSWLGGVGLVLEMEKLVEVAKERRTRIVEKEISHLQRAMEMEKG